MRAAIAIVVLSLACSTKSQNRTVRIAAASDLARAFEELGKTFEAKTHITPIYSFDSSGLLAKRIEQGAPYFVFASANKDFAEKVVAQGRCDRASMRSHGRGRIVVWWKTGTKPPTSLADLTDPRFARIAIANPEHAPYGKAAKQALEKAGIWSQLEGERIKYGDSVQAAMQYARSGTVDVAVVALSLAVVTEGGAFLPIDPALYEPLDQQIVVCGKGPEADAAQRFVDYVSSADGRDIMKRYGFSVDDETERTPVP